MSAAAYLYAVARPFDPAPLAALRGIDGAPFGLVAGEPGLVAVVSPLARPEALGSRCDDVVELEALARAHDAVVAAVATHTATVPLRLATVHLDESRVRAALRRHRRSLDAALDRVAGRVEMGVKVFAVPGESPRPDDPAAAPATSGRDYLRRRREATRALEAGREQAAATAAAIDRALAGLAAASRHHPPQDPRLSGVPGENVLNASYLVDRAVFPAVEAHAAEHRLPRTLVEVTGPWAPYSFAELADLEDAP